MGDATIYRIQASSLSVYEKSDTAWKKSKRAFPNAMQVAKLFKQHRNLKQIIDPKNPQFLIGMHTGEAARGGRIDILPSGEKLTKAYPLFADHLTIHDESSNFHWDVLFQNPSGSYTYIYTKEKNQAARQKKFHSVEEFAKLLPKLKRNLTQALSEDPLALPMLILLKTKMRVGSERYYKKNHHKGLTTLQKKDLTIKANKVTFRYIAKDGVPMKITESFPTQVISKLQKLLKTKKQNDFVFTTARGHPLKDTAFEKAFLEYSGKKFYPHIVRSHYATEEAMRFFKKHKKVTPDQVRKLYESIAQKLGHKKFSKKTGEWKESYNVTLQYYVQQEIAEKIAGLVSSH